MSGARSMVPLALALALAPRGARAEPPRERHVGEGLFSGWKHADNAEGALFGVEPTASRAVGPGRSATSAGAEARLWAQIFGKSWYPADDKSFRFLFDGALGGDTSGLRGQARFEGAFGLRWALDGRDDDEVKDAPLYRQLDRRTRDSLDRIFHRSPHSLFARAGLRVEAGGDHVVSASRVEIPHIELGWAHEGDWAAELRVEAGFLLVGRYHTLSSTAKTGGAPAWGAQLVLHQHRWVHVELGASRIEALGRSGGPIHALTLLSCLHRGTRKRFLDDETRTFLGVCGDVRASRGEFSGGFTATTLRAGVLLSLTWPQ